MHLGIIGCFYCFWIWTKKQQSLARNCLAKSMQDGIVCLQIWQNPGLRHSFEDLDGVYPFLMPRARYNHRCTGDDIGPWFMLPLRSRNFIEGFQHVLDISTIPIPTNIVQPFSRQVAVHQISFLHPAIS